VQQRSHEVDRWLDEQIAEAVAATNGHGDD
jgi:hypothetical protein